MRDNLSTYCLLIKKEKGGKLQIGKLGVFDFPPGYYVYTGSAKKGLKARINRHLSLKKNLRWHIDYLLEKSVVEAIFLSKKKECEVNREVFSLPRATIVTNKFGSSDCSCRSHLAYFLGKSPILDTIGELEEDINISLNKFAL